MIQVGKPVFGTNLIGRENEIRLIKELLKAGQSVVLIAPRRMGKTSLLLELLTQFKNENHFTVFTDVFASPDISVLSQRITESVFANRKFDGAFKRAILNISEAFKNLQFRTEIEDFSFVLDFGSNTDHKPLELLEKSVDFIENYSIRHQKKCIAAFDEFGDIKKLDGEEIVKLFRSKIQNHHNTAYLFTGSYESVMEELFVGKNSPFFRMARIINLGNIHPDDFLPYMQSTLETENINVPKNQLKEILDFSDGHPYYTQLYLQEMMIQIKLNPAGEIPKHQDMIGQLLLIEKNYLEKYWEELSSSKELRQIAIALAKSREAIYSRLGKSNVNISRGLSKLKGKGIINEKNQLADPLFQEWIRVNILRETENLID